MSLTQALLQEIFLYRDGVLYWATNRGSRAQVGQRAGGLSGGPYEKISIGGKLYLTHRLIYCWHTGKTPRYVDHIDRNPLNNQIENLRGVSATENLMNRKLAKSSSSGFKGVSWNKRDKRWRAMIGVNNKNIFLGNFLTKEEAAKAYDSKALEIYGLFAVVNFPENSSAVGV